MAAPAPVAPVTTPTAAVAVAGSTSGDTSGGTHSLSVPEYTIADGLQDGGAGYTLEVSLPRVAKSRQIDLSVNTGAVELHAAGIYAPLNVNLPRPVEDGGAMAKWESKKRVLRIGLPLRNPATRP